MLLNFKKEFDTLSRYSLSYMCSKSVTLIMGHIVGFGDVRMSMKLHYCKCKQISISHCLKVHFYPSLAIFDSVVFIEIKKTIFLCCASLLETRFLKSNSLAYSEELWSEIFQTLIYESLNFDWTCWVLRA